MRHICVQCGAELLRQGRFCTACGHPTPNADLGPEDQRRDCPIVFLDRLNVLHDTVIPRVFSRFFGAISKHSEINRWKSIFLDLQVDILFGYRGDDPDDPFFFVDDAAPRITMTLGSLISLAAPLNLGPLPSGSTHVVISPKTMSFGGNVSADLIRDECFKRVPISVRIADGYGIFGVVAFWNKRGDEFFNTPLRDWLSLGIEIPPVDGSVLITLQTDGSRVKTAVELVGG